MDDLATRLRERRITVAVLADGSKTVVPDPDCIEAADELDRLRAVIAQAAEELEAGEEFAERWLEIAQLSGRERCRAIAEIDKIKAARRAANKALAAATAAGDGGDDGNSQ